MPEEDQHSIGFLEKVIDFYGADRIDALYADQVLIQSANTTDGGVVSTLLFYQLQFPESQEAREKTVKLPARCVGKFVLGPGLVERLYSALGKNVDRITEINKLRESTNAGSADTQEQ